ncbi:MAG: pyridoxamine 5'-phosphate oxidase family protein [Thermodesulfovibrionales bacterium]
MILKHYLESREGKSILSTANAEGMVTSAIYSRPHVFDDGTIAFVMRKRLSHENLKTNPYAAYMFIEEGHGYQGIRLFLKKIKEDTDNVLIDRMKRRHLTPEEDDARGPKFLICFRVERILPLIGDGDPGIALT